ncbi:LysR family substrate-binding domain-containing protein [Microbacterium sp.]|uniref:LysR family substrate-binding domain-containing protein n=1 Tax=Microbacterium sp. TaxID=51671 RepID=UPI0039E33BAD
MAGGGGSARRGGRPRRATGTPQHRPQGAERAAGRNTRRVPTPVESAPPLPPGPFRLGAVPGTTPGKWIDAWRSRMPGVELELVPLAVADQRERLSSAELDAALVRLPLRRDDLHVIALYDEVPVVVCAADSHLTAADELTVADLTGEVIIRPVDAVIEVEVSGAVPAVFAPPETTEEAIATVATGVGVTIVPMSLARLHHRKDVEYRPLREGPVSTVALAWPSEAPSALVDVFVGIVRGRTANSSRG